MEQRRRRQQRSRERKETVEPQVEIGAADRRLDALIEEELKAKAARAQSVPVRAAEVKRLGVAAGAGSGQGGPPVVAASSGHPGQQEIRQLLNDPRGQAMGLGYSGDLVQALHRPSTNLVGMQRGATCCAG